MSDATESQSSEDWMNSKWRPMAAWCYMVICMCDFVVFPVLWSLFHVFFHTGQVTQWQPLTLQGAGMLHLSFGAILGVAAFGRTQEKLAGANNGGLNVTGGYPPVPVPPQMPVPPPAVSRPSPPRAPMPEI